MMTGNALYDLLLLSVPAMLIGLWWTGSRARELAIQHARNACKLQQLQLLDQTVALRRVRPSRTATGASCFLRTYDFEFTDQGQYRDSGTVIMQGHALKKVHFPYTRDAEGNRIYVH